MATALARKRKVERIEELASLGFNTPRQYYLEPYEVFEKLHSVKKWVKSQLRKGAKMINVRTYKWDDGRETLESKHYVNIPFEKLEEVLIEAREWECLVDVESGVEDGVVAGTIEIDFANNRYVFGYYQGPGAMVRMADRETTGDLEPLSFEGDLDSVVKATIDSAVNVILGQWPINRRDFQVQFELSLHRAPCGVRGERLIFWEYRAIGG